MYSQALAYKKPNKQFGVITTSCMIFHEND
uniref:Uncharacterized protein n=1 Tax=Arundo donax TaxID=35708 RepID=A0A0A9A5K9_ARUDO